MSVAGFSKELVLGGMLLAPAIKTHCARFSQPATKGLQIADFRQHRCRWRDWPEWSRYTPYHPAAWPCTCILAPGFWRCHSSADSTSSQSASAAPRPGPEQKAQAMSHRPNSPVAQVKRANRSRQHLYPLTWTLQMLIFCYCEQVPPARIQVQIKSLWLRADSSSPTADHSPLDIWARGRDHRSWLTLLRANG